jgi:hypothetical protein
MYAKDLPFCVQSEPTAFVKACGPVDGQPDSSAALETIISASEQDSAAADIQRLAMSLNAIGATAYQPVVQFPMYCEAEGIPALGSRLNYELRTLVLHGTTPIVVYQLLHTPASQALPQDHYGRGRSLISTILNAKESARQNAQFHEGQLVYKGADARPGFSMSEVGNQNVEQTQSQLLVAHWLQPLRS